MQEVSKLFVVVMGMGVTFVGLTCIIFLTMAMGKIMCKFDKPEIAKASVPAAVPAAPSTSADGLTDSVKIAILAAIAQEPGLSLTDANVTIRKK